MVLIEDYDHMTLMDENMNWINLLSKFSLNLWTPFCIYWKTLNLSLVKHYVH